MRAEHHVDPSKPNYRAFDCGHTAGSDRPPILRQMRWMTVAEVAAAARVCRMTVYRMIHAGELPASRFGRSFRIDEQAVVDLLKAGQPARDTLGVKS